MIGIRGRTVRVACASAVAALVLLGCDGSQDGPGGSGDRTLLLYCGAGMRLPAAEIIDAFHKETGVTVQADYAGSGTLISRIKAGRIGDLYMPGAVAYVDDLQEQTGLVDSKKMVTYFVPCLIVARGNPLKIRTLADLGRPGLKVALGDDRACQIGRTTRKILEKNALDRAAIDKNVVMTSVTVNELPLWVKTKTIDATIAWDAVAAGENFADAVETVPIPLEQNIISRVAVGVLTCSKDLPLARQFADFLAGPTAQAIFEKHHYRITAPE
jgi:molybdate transport system substrate-binding protein